MNEQKNAEAMAHLRRVWQMSPELGRLDEETVAELEAYLAHIDSADAQWEMVRDKLDASPELAAVWARLVALAQAEERGEWAASALDSQPTADLSFLQAETDEPTLLRLLRERVTTTAEQVRLRLDEILVTALAPPPALATRSASPRYGAHLLSLLPEQGSLLPFDLTLNAYEDAEQGGHCLVEVTVARPGKEWPELAGTVVSLRYGASHHTAVTDAWGTAVFADVPRPSLRSLDIEVLY